MKEKPPHPFFTEMSHKLVPVDVFTTTGKGLGYRVYFLNEEDKGVARTSIIPNWNRVKEFIEWLSLKRNQEDAVDTLTMIPVYKTPWLSFCTLGIFFRSKVFMWELVLNDEHKTKLTGFKALGSPDDAGMDASQNLLIM